jgi:hypothetical protein
LNGSRKSVARTPEFGVRGFYLELTVNLAYPCGSRTRVMVRTADLNDGGLRYIHGLFTFAFCHLHFAF